MSHAPPPSDSLNLLQKTSQQIGRSLSFRLTLMAVLVLISLIPMAFVSHLIQERQSLQSAARDEIALQWAGPQTLTGPVLSLPYRKQTVQQVTDPNNLEAAPKNKVIESIAYLHFVSLQPPSQNANLGLI
ncbi:MAG: inner membrane CreD family protein [Candidatus Sericytochromatia bacterium]|nr:inner membrane CreD family protein [Candidatus Sericytochromatia bacterium]